MGEPTGSTRAATCGRNALIAVVELRVELLGPVLDHRVAEHVGKVLRRRARRPVGRDRDQVALRDRVGLDVVQQRARAAVRVELRLALRATSIDVTRRAAVWTSRVGSFDSRIRPGIEFRVSSLAGDRGDEQVGLGLVRLLGGADVECGGERGHEHAQHDQLPPLTDRLDIAAQALLGLPGQLPVGSLGLDVGGLDQARDERGPRAIKDIRLYPAPRRFLLVDVSIGSIGRNSRGAGAEVIISCIPRRGGRADECGGLENRWAP